MYNKTQMMRYFKHGLVKKQCIDNVLLDNTSDSLQPNYFLTIPEQIYLILFQIICIKIFFLKYQLHVLGYGIFTKYWLINVELKSCSKNTEHTNLYFKLCIIPYFVYVYDYICITCGDIDIQSLDLYSD